jgi:cysteine desulfurase
MIYLDNNATTKLAPEALDAMLPYFSEVYQNPSSVVGEVLGVKSAIARARRSLASLLGLSEPNSLVFTSGATESNNWVVSIISEIFGAPRRLITSAVEHPSVIEPLRRLERLGWPLTVVPVDRNGVVRKDILEQSLTSETAFVSIMAANNESGVVQPVGDFAALVKELAPQAYFHTDATQMTGKLPVSFDDGWSQIDFLSLSGHKFHGPKGIGALVIRDGMDVPPWILGGGQEDGRRSGTSNAPSIIGIAVAADHARKNLAKDGAAIVQIRDWFEAEIQNRLPDVVIHGTNAYRLPNTSCFSIPGCDANHLAELLAGEGICLGTGSACSSGALHPPRTLLEMGVDHKLAAAALRLSLSRYSSQAEVQALIERLVVLRQTAILPMDFEIISR